MKMVIDVTPPAPGASGKIELYNIDFDLLTYAPDSVLSTTFLYSESDDGSRLSLSFPEGWKTADMTYLSEYDELHLQNDQGGQIVLVRE